MRALLYINGKKVRFWGEGGWYPGGEFALLRVSIGEAVGGLPTDTYTILSILCLYFNLAFGFELLKDLPNAGKEM
jgi:hypothetical protein